MSDHTCNEPGLHKRFHCDQDNQERTVDIYVSEESLRVYENPWVPDQPPNRPGREEPQQVFVVSGHPGGRSQADSVFLGVACLLLLVGMMAIIYLGVQIKNERHERKQLMADKANLKNLWDKLTTNITEFCSDGDRTWEKFCRRIRKKCERCKKRSDSYEDL